MSLMIKDIQLLKNYNKIWEKIEKLMKTDFNTKTTYAYEKYHPQTFLEECKYAKENIKTNNYIDKELKSESESDRDSDIDIDINNEK